MRAGSSRHRVRHAFADFHIPHRLDTSHPAVVGASVSPNVVPRSEKSRGCIAYQLNTEIRHVITRTTQQDAVHYLYAIRTNHTALKSVDTFLKHSGGTQHLADFYALLQESK